MNLFVYGTLKKGHGNHYLIESCKQITKGYIEGFQMVSAMIPFVWYGNQNDKVYGEVYEVSDFIIKQLDILEGHPNFYQRTWLENYGFYIYLHDFTKRNLNLEKILIF